MVSGKLMAVGGGGGQQLEGKIFACTCLDGHDVHPWGCLALKKPKHFLRLPSPVCLELHISRVKSPWGHENMTVPHLLFVKMGAFKDLLIQEKCSSCVALPLFQGTPLL